MDLVAWLLPVSEDYSESVDAIGRALETLEKQAPSSPSVQVFKLYQVRFGTV